MLIVGGAIVDATVLDREPTRQQPNVEVQPAAEPQRSLPAPETTNVEAVPLVPRWLVAEDAKAKNQIAIDGGSYTLRHLTADGMAIDLVVPGCAREASIVVDGIAHDGRGEGAPAYFTDGTYEIAASCDGAVTPATHLVVERRR